MGAIRAAAAVILIVIGVMASAAECVTGTRVLSTNTSVPNLVAGPAAWSGSVLAIAKTQDGAPGAAWIALYDDDLATVAGDRLLVNDARTLYALVWSGTEFGLFYRTTTQSLSMQRVSATGEPVGGPITVSPGRPAFAGDQVKVRWSERHQAYVVAHLVTQSSSRGVYLTFLEKNGTQMSSRPLFVVAAEQSPLALAVTPGGVVGTFFIASSGSVVLAVTTGVNDTPVARPVVAMTSGELQAVAYREEFVLVRTAPFEGQTVIRWLAVSPAHDITRFDGPLVAGTLDVTPQALIVGDDELAMSYIDSRDASGSLDDTFRLRRFTRAGTLISDTLFAPTDVSATRAVSPHPFIWTGGTYLAPAVRSTPDRLTSYLLEYCPLRVQILAPVTVLVGQAVTFSPSTTGGVPGYTYVWKFSNSARTEGGTVTSVERTFGSTGRYTATLVATDATGVSKTATFTFNVAYPRRRAVRR